MTSGFWGPIAIAAQSVGTLALAAVFAAPSPVRSADEAPIATTRVASGDVVVYRGLADICSDLAAGDRADGVRVVGTGTAIRILHVADARCGDATVPMLEVRVDDRESPQDGVRGYVVRADAPLPVGGD